MTKLIDTHLFQQYFHLQKKDKDLQIKLQYWIMYEWLLFQNKYKGDCNTEITSGAM